jgi:hypothetical protein
MLIHLSLGVRKSLLARIPLFLVSNEGAGDVTPATIQGKIDQHKPDLVILRLSSVVQ